MIAQTALRWYQSPQSVFSFFLFHVILSLPKDLGVPHIPPVIASESVAISGDGNHNQMWKFFPPPYRHSERSVGIQRSASKSSACVRSTLHQAIGRAKLRQDFLTVLDLRAYARLCGEIARASKVLSNKRTLVAFTYAPLEQ